MRKLLLIALVSCFAVVAHADNPKMKECAAEWQKMKADGKTEGKDYKEFSATCLKGAKEEVKTTQQDKMKACAEEWNKLKAANKTEGKTYQEFSSACLKK